MSHETTSKADAYTIYSKITEETIETAIQRILENLGARIFIWTKISQELEARTKLQKKGLTAEEVKALMSSEKKRIHKSLEKDQRLTTKGSRELLNIHSQRIKEQSIDSHTIEDLHYNVLNGVDKSLRIIDATKLVYTFTALAELEQQQSNAITAWKAMAKAQYYHGLLTGLDDPNTFLINERASKGGDARSQNINQKKLSQKIMLDLLYKMVPQNKWRSFPAAADAVIGPLIKKLRSETLTLPLTENELKADLTDLVAKHKDTFIKS